MRHRYVVHLVRQLEGHVQVAAILLEEDLDVAAVAGEGYLARAGVLAGGDAAVYDRRRPDDGSIEWRVGHVIVAQPGWG